MTQTHPCPIATCHGRMPVNAILCYAHWSAVPVAYQRQVLIRRNQVARALKNPELLLSRLRSYRQACRVAVDSVRNKERVIA